MFNRLSIIPLWPFLLILGIITFFAHPIFFPSDLKVYACNALNFYLGKGYTNIDGSLIFFRAPLFPLLISISYWLFGVSHVSTFWVIKIFCVLNPLIVYAIGTRFFNKRVGVSAAFLILTSYAINFLSFRHIDAIWPFFILLSTLFFYLGFEKNKTRFFILAGIGLALSYLVKEASFLFFPVPFLMFVFVKDYRKISFLKNALWGYLASFVVILPWPIYIFSTHEAPNLLMLLGRGGTRKFYQITNPSGPGDWGNLPLLALGKLKTLFSGFLQFYHGTGISLDQWFILAPLFIIAWLYVFSGAIQGNKHLRILTILFLLYTPIIYFQGARNMRIGQSAIIYLLSYLALAASMDSFLKMVSVKIKRIANNDTLVFSSLIACLVVIQVFVNFRSDLGYKTFFLKNQWREIFSGNTYGAGPYGPNSIAGDKELLGIIRQYSTPPNRLYMAITNRSLAKESYFSLKTGHRVYYHFQSQIDNYPMQMAELRPDEQPIYITVRKLAGMKPHILKAIYLSQLLEMIQKDGVTHVLVERFNRETGGNRGLDKYFSAYPDFKRIPLPLEEFSIYEVLPNAAISTPPDLPPIMDIESLNTLFSISSEKSRKNLAFLKKCFKILHPTNPCETSENKSINRVYDSDENNLKASFLNNAGMKSLYNGNHEKAIESFKESICFNPDFAEAYRNLFYTTAIMERQKAIALKPENPVSYFHYAIFLQRNGFYETALFNINKAVTLDPKYAEAYVALGTIYTKQNKYNEAIDAFQKATTIYKDFVGSRKNWMIYMNYVLIGDSYLKLGKPLKARKSYKRAILAQSEPKYKIQAYFKLGVLCNKLNDYPSAIENLQMAVQLNPNSAEAYYLLSQTHLILGDKNKASKHFKKLKKIKPTLADKLNRESGWVLE
ncbi:tetratricopeptide repeat protein [Thermodesulfobacteriota bacterium]